MTTSRVLTRDDLKRVEDKAKAMDSDVEWTVEAQDYGWRLALTGSLIVADEQVRFGKAADQASDPAVRDLIRESATLEAFLDKWTDTWAFAIAKRLHAFTPANVEAAKARNARIRHDPPAQPAGH